MSIPTTNHPDDIEITTGTREISPTASGTPGTIDSHSTITTIADSDDFDSRHTRNKLRRPSDRGAYNENSFHNEDNIAYESSEGQSSSSWIPGPLQSFLNGALEESSHAERSKHRQKEQKETARLKSANSQLEKELKDLKKSFAAVNRDYDMLSQSMDRMVKSNSLRTADAEKRERLIIRLQNEKQALSAEKRSLEHALQTAEQKEREALQKINFQQIELRRTNAQLLQLEEDLQKKEEGIVALRQEGLERLGQSSRKSLDDTIVRRNLRSDFAVATTNWAKAFAKPRMKDLSGGGIDFVMSCLRGAGAWKETAEQTIYQRGVLPRTFLQCFLTDFMASNILEKPFLAVLLHDLETSDKSQKAENLAEFYDMFKKVDPAGAHLWRSNLLNLEYSKPPSPLAVKKFCKYLMLKLRSTNLKELLELDATEELEEGLREIFDGVISLSTELWRQRTDLRIARIADYRDMLFSFNDPMDPDCKMVADGTYKLADSSQPDKFDGSEVSMLVQPGILAFGDDRGENYNGHPKIWLPATVRLVIEPNNPRESLTAGFESQVQEQPPILTPVSSQEDAVELEG